MIAGLTLSDRKRKGLFEPARLSKGKHRITLQSGSPFLLDQIAVVTTPVAAVDYLNDEK